MDLSGVSDYLLASSSATCGDRTGSSMITKKELGHRGDYLLVCFRTTHERDCGTSSLITKKDLSGVSDYLLVCFRTTPERDCGTSSLITKKSWATGVIISSPLRPPPAVTGLARR